MLPGIRADDTEERDAMAKKKDANEQPFEKNLKDLEEIVEKLESGTISLDRALELFQEGKALAKACEARLKQVELRIQKLVEADDETLEVEEFEAEEAGPEV
jgi:exodeoxyribonuclease VII small subunit